MKIIYQTISEKMETWDFEKMKSALQKAIQNLPEDQQQVIYYHFYDGLTVKKIAKKLNCSETSVYCKIKKAQYNLHKQIDPSYYRKAMEKAKEILYGDIPN